MHGIYAALSYSWGDDSSSMLKLRELNLAALQGEIKFGELRRSHQHGIQVARELGYDYIWIDALCIIQGDSHDWAKQASLILEIYGNADLTIVAGRSDDSKKGFLESMSATSSALLAQLPYSSWDGMKTCCFIGRLRNRIIGPVSDRAWCFQEALISRRMIIYGEQQLSFRCRERHDFEDGHWESVGPRDAWYNYSFLARHLASPGFHPKVFQADNRNSTDRLNFKVQSILNSLPASTGIDFTGIGQILKAWYGITTEYSSRSFFDPTDNHAALSGMVRLMQQALTRCGLDSDRVRYMAGLWEIDMVDGLLWSSHRITDWQLTALQAPVYEGRVVRRAPSWSWMALVGPICQRSSVGQRLCRPANPDRKTWSPEPDGWGPSMIEYKKFPDPFRLEVKAYIREVRISQQRKSEPSFNIFDLDAARAGSERSIAKHTVPLEVADSGGTKNESTAFATALFDMEYAGNRPVQMWAMSVTSEEGLLLKQSQDPKFGSVVYERLGIYAVDAPSRPDAMPTFYPKESLGMESFSLNGYFVIKDKLPMETVVLI
ncbi:hypothetical protein OEA41_007420 [Lepraria neglecta]|uniref:Heterokaryon incompatibility domain-containing protein n=1 Tax=Lepraria neglecta TaxID=209136 RepID=A0AAE0DMY1_9LECA|nr:hypothetical protein OEA41_007420 [Lepraria neglecta]